VNPGVGHVAANHRDVGLLGDDGIGKIRQPSDADFHAGELLGCLGE
jgi:hypothetical protein